MALAFTLEWLLARWYRAPGPATLMAAPLALPIVIYGASNILATAFSIDPPRSLSGSADKHGTFTVLCSLAFFFLMFDTLRTREQVSRLITALLLGTVPVAVYAIAQFLGMDPLDWLTDSVSPMSSTMGRSNFLGAYLAIVFPFTLFRLVSEFRGADRSSSGSSLAGEAPPPPGLLSSGRRCWRVASLALLQMTCVFLSQARAAWLSLTGGALVFVGILALRRRSRGLFLFFVGVLLVGASLFVPLSRIDLPALAGLSSIRHSPELPFPELRAGTVNSRFAIWRDTLALIPDRLPLGYGPESFATVFGARYGARYGNIIVDDPHNLVLDHLVALGVLGFMAFLSVAGTFYIVAIRALRRARDEYQEGLSAATLGSATAFLIQAQFNPDVIVTWVLFWLVLALASIGSDTLSPPLKYQAGARSCS